MAEYIDRVALLKTIFPYDAADKSKFAINAKVVEKAIKGASTADVVEVVRCKDCKHFHEYKIKGGIAGWGKCEAIAMDIDLMANDYCCYGERKEQE